MSKVGGYGYADDESQVSVITRAFGLNAGKTFLSKFGYTANGGKGGEAAEALDIVLTINGSETSMRMFPVTQAYGENNVIITDINHPKMIEAFDTFNGIISHLLRAFLTKEQIQAAFQAAGQAGHLNSFASYCNAVASMFPAGCQLVPLDVFMQYQWQVQGENTRTFLQVPKTMKYGAWLCRAVQPLNADGTLGEWKEVRKESPADTDTNALMYVDGKGNIHPFVRSGWFVKSNFANEQREDGEDTATDGSAIGGQAQAAAVGAAPAQPKPAGW